MFEGSPSILFAQKPDSKKKFEAFVCQNRPQTKKRVYFDNHTVPKFAWYGQLSDGTRFIAVKSGKKWGMISHRYMTPWSQEIVPGIMEFICNTPCSEQREIETERTHINQGQVIRKGKTKSRLTSKKIEKYCPHGKMSLDYKQASIKLYGETINMNGKKYSVETASVSAYMDGTGMGPRFDNSDRRPLEPQFPVKSGKHK